MGAAVSRPQRSGEPGPISAVASLRGSGPAAPTADEPADMGPGSRPGPEGGE